MNKSTTKVISNSKKVDLSEFQDVAKFNFVIRILIMCSVSILGLLIYSILAHSTFLSFYLISYCLLVVCVAILRYNNRRGVRRYKFITAFLFSAIFLVLILSIFTQTGNLHQMEAFWMLIICLSSFFILGNIWGSFFALLLAAVYGTYFTFYFADTVQAEIFTQPGSLFRNSLELLIAMLIVIYIMYEYGQVNKHALAYAEEALEKLKEEKIVVENQNIEKTILLQEIHHRVKNNLQVIVSLLRLQSNSLQTPEAKESFQDTINRIMSMSLIHQKLYETESFVKIDLEDYFSSLIGTLVRTYSTDKDVEFTISSEISGMQLNKLPSLGLIVNELVSNSLKHAFSDNGVADESAKIELKLIKGEEEGVINLLYSDNGSWKTPKGISFGTKLIDIFTEQLDGEYNRVSSEAGTVYSFVLLI